MTQQRNSTGFTLVELMLSMAFLSMLLLAIALLILQISSIYNKGLTLKAVNEAGQLITSDLQRTLNTASPDAKMVPDLETNPEATGGRLCTGQTVYAWNFGRALVDDNDADKPFNITASGDTDIRLVKFSSNASAGNSVVDYCQINDEGEYPVLPDETTTLIAAGGNNLALHEFSVATQEGSDGMVLGEPVGPTGGKLEQRIYTIEMVIGTNEKRIQDAEINSNGCEAPESRVDDEYCAVNKFEFTARSGNAAKGANL